MAVRKLVGMRRVEVDPTAFVVRQVDDVCQVDVCMPGGLCMASGRGTAGGRCIQAVCCVPHVLHMAGCGLYSDGLACAIASALPFNSTLTRLSLRRQRIGAHWRETCFKRVRCVRVVHHVRTSSDV